MQDGVNNEPPPLVPRKFSAADITSKAKPNTYVKINQPLKRGKNFFLIFEIFSS